MANDQQPNSKEYPRIKAQRIGPLVIPYSLGLGVLSLEIPARLICAIMARLVKIFHTTHSLLRVETSTPVGDSPRNAAEMPKMANVLPDSCLRQLINPAGIDWACLIKAEPARAQPLMCNLLMSS
jgi:hypothetical protein